MKTTNIDLSIMLALVHKKHPGWRFLLLGGDVQYSYKTNRNGEFLHRDGGLVIDRKKRHAFGWRAAFLGHIDPAKNYGDRHVSVWAPDVNKAILMACKEAMKIRPKKESGK